MSKRRAVPDPELTEVIGGSDDGTKIPRKKFLVLLAAEWLLKEENLCRLPPEMQTGFKEHCTEVTWLERFFNNHNNLKIDVIWEARQNGMVPV